ncbi:hypothetical protein AGMMS50225_08160 [Betaproteobacteria bacterium]|nr:hypothetical protein AGMMS50225_08160 [Betaproteobacteria bacterium]
MDDEALINRRERTIAYTTAENVLDESCGESVVDQRADTHKQFILIAFILEYMRNKFGPQPWIEVIAKISL